MIDFIAHLTPLYLYPFLFVGITFLGGLVLMPAMYLTHVGAVSLLYLFLITIFAGAVSDSVWYFIGSSAKKEKLYSFRFIKNKIQEAGKFSEFFSKHGVRLVFFTKFVYGTRIASHVLAGLHKIGYARFLGATMAGTATWFAIFYFLIRSINVGITAAKATAFRIQILFLGVVAILLVVNWFTGKYLRKKMMKSDTL
jgi:membrane protein DedA with SNARE-associated domain